LWKPEFSRLSISLRPRALQPKTWLIGLMLFAMLSFFGLCAINIWESRIDAQREADVSAENIGQLFDGDIQRTFEDYNLLLQNVSPASATR
jgi:hypothetical protein